MEFNRYLWDLYRESKEGKAAIGDDISRFATPNPFLPETPPFTYPFDFHEVLNDEFVENGKILADEIDLRQEIKKYAAPKAVTNLDEAEKLFIEIAGGGLTWTIDDEGKCYLAGFAGGDIEATLYEDVLVGIEGLSTGLHDAHPEFFAPYLFPTRFDKFQKICDAFGIPLPEMPGKLKKRERALYYLGVNRMLQDFRKHHELSPCEFNAFLYDFAQKNIALRKSGDLPPPACVWFVIGGVENDDFNYLEGAAENSDASSHWQGNLETRSGDILLMWCTSPVSALHSVWRALDEGFNDPYFPRYATIRIGHPVKIPRISFSEFAKHPLLGNLPAVRARFQGKGGTAFPVEGYQAVLEILKGRGFDISLLPPPPKESTFSTEGLKNEHDVELTLLEPLLGKLGFAETDWIRQFPLRMGRGERNYPDYILGGKPQPGDESAFAVIECKFDIDTGKALKEAFVQAKSYALRLQAAVLALAARRGLWVFQVRSDGFSFDHFIFKTWDQLSHPDELHRISLLIGKRAVETATKRRKRN